MATDVDERDRLIKVVHEEDNEEDDQPAGQQVGGDVKPDPGPVQDEISNKNESSENPSTETKPDDVTGL